GIRGVPAAAAGASSIPDTVTLTILQDVTVLACGRNMSRRTMESDMPERFGGDQYSAVTISVTPREAEMLVFAHNKGKLTLALRNREDVTMPPLTESVDFGKLEKNFGQLNTQRQQRLHPMPGGFTPLPAPAALPAATPAPAPAAPPAALPAPASAPAAVPAAATPAPAGARP
ncbi:MAG: hypothetical protein FJ388_19780, partial [Verrucomicrobia bacterium]|nr:hypothetical protein [Verrucomicrobiota bacterium]